MGNRNTKVSNYGWEEEDFLDTSVSYVDEDDPWSAPPTDDELLDRGANTHNPRSADENPVLGRAIVTAKLRLSVSAIVSGRHECRPARSWI